MKQTNNAIKFLMAQYRAIFKSAYFKGMATALVLTAGLAAGQAQAVDGPYYSTDGNTWTTTAPGANRVAGTIAGVHQPTATEGTTASGADFKLGQEGPFEWNGSGSIYGGYVDTTKLKSGKDVDVTATNNKLTLDADSVVIKSGSANVIGGWAKTQNGFALASDNKVFVKADTSNPTDGSSTLKSGGQVIGAWASSLNGATAQNNTVELSGNNKSGDTYLHLGNGAFGAMAFVDANATGGDYVAQGNTLDVSYTSSNGSGDSGLWLIGGYAYTNGTTNNGTGSADSLQAIGNSIIADHVTIGSASGSGSGLVVGNLAANNLSGSIADVVVNGNGQETLKISDSTFYHSSVFGGQATNYAGGSATANANTVNITDSDFLANTSGNNAIFGGQAATTITGANQNATLDASSNTVSITNSKADKSTRSVLGSIYGAQVKVASGSSSGISNFVGTTLTANNNSVTVGEGITVSSGSVYGAYIASDGTKVASGGATINASNNSVTFNGTFTGGTDTHIAGVIAEPGLATMNNNQVTINGKVSGVSFIYGAFASKQGKIDDKIDNPQHNLNNNSITIGSKAEVTGAKIWAAGSAETSALTFNNDVTIEGTVKNSDVYGGTGADSAITLAAGGTLAYTSETAGTTNVLRSDVVNLAGTVNVGTNDTLKISGFVHNGNQNATTYNTNETNIASSATIYNRNTVELLGDTTVANGAKLHALAAGAKILVNGDVSGSTIDDTLDPDNDIDFNMVGGRGSLNISTSDLKSYLTAGDAYTLGSVSSTDKAGTVDLASGGVLHFTDNSVVISDFDYSTTDAPGKITVETDTSKGGSVIKGNELTIAHKFAQNATDAKTYKDLQEISATGIKVDANTLNLGSSTLSSDQSAAIKFAEAKAKEEINFIARTSGKDISDDTGNELTTSNDGFHLTSKVVGSNFMLTNDQDSNNEYYTSLAGNINGVVTVEGANGEIHIKDGDWTANDLVTVASSGTVTVGNGTEAESLKDSSSLPDATLSLAAGLVLDVTASGTATVTANGDQSSAYQEPDSDDFYGDNRYVALDLTHGVDMKGTSDGKINGKAVIEATSGGVVLLNASDVNDLLAQNHAAGVNSGSGAFLNASSGGELRVDGDITAQFRDFDGSGDTNGFNLSGDGNQIVDDATSGRLVANSLTIVNPHSGTVKDDADYIATAPVVHLGGAVIVDNLEINDLQQTNGKDKPAGSNTYASQVTIADGGAQISHSLTSFNDKLILGDEGNSSAILYFETDAVADEGTISVNKIELASGSEIDFANGKWDASATDFNLSGAGSSLIVGDDYDYDVNENPYSATLKAGDLTMGDGTYLYVAANGTASFNGANLEELSAPTADNDKAGILVEGYLTINGTAISDTNKNGGVTFGEAGSIRIANNGTLNFGKAAVNGAIVADGQHTGDTVTLRDGYSKIDNQGGTLRLDLADNTKFSANAIQSLKKQLFTDGSFNSDGILKAGGLLNIGKANFDGFSGYDKVDDPAKGLYGYTATWDEVKDFSDIFSEDVTNDMNSTANITGIEPGDEVKGAWGSLSMNPNVPTTAQVTLAGNTTLSYAEGNNGLFISDNDHKIALGAIVGSQKTFNLVNGGSIGKVTLTNGKDNANDDRNLTTLNINGNGNLTTINGIDTVISNNTTAYATRVNVNSDADVTGDITGVGRVNVNEGATLHVYNPDASSKDAPEVLVNTLAVRNGNAKIDGDLIIDGQYSSDRSHEGFAGDGEAFAIGGSIAANNIELEHSADLTTVHGGLISAETVTAVADSDGKSYSLIAVGNDLDYETWDDTEETPLTGTGYLEISKYLDLNGGTLMVDPAYGEATSVAAVMNFKEGNDKTWDSVTNDVGIIDGRALIGKNAALGIGASLEETRAAIADFQENGSLSKDKYGSILYLNGQLTIANGSEIALNADPVTSDVDGIRRALKYTITSNQLDQFATLGLGANTAILMSEAAFEDADGKKTQTAIHFDRESAVINANGGEIVLIGAFDASEKLNFFSDNDSGNNNGVDIVNASGADGTIKVYTQNGFLFATLTGKNQGQGVQLHVDEDKAFSVMNQASYPVVETLISYHEDRIAQDTTTTPETPAPEAGEEDQSGSSIPAEKILTQSELASRTSEQETRETIPAEPIVPQEPNTPEANTRVTGSSDFLNEVVTKSHGAPAEAAARLAIYGGAVQAAMAATSSTTDAIAARMGVGDTAAITMANNGQGAALWLAPVYKTHDSDSFDSQGLDYGVDLNLYGVALGADFEFMPGLTAGIMFNVGSGDADGQGNAAANNTSNDFDYWGAAIYGNYTYDALSVTADVSYTAVDNDLEATTGMDQFTKLESSTDTTAISLGVTAKYTFDFGGVEVAPHAGLRYTNIDLDDYSIKSNGETIADYSADKVNIFSIPVGVTFAKEFTGDAWTVKPSLDLTLTGNFGDDDISGDVSWTGVDGLVTPVSSEYMDDFTYGATLGIEAASTGGFSLGLGVNYTGSSNVDEFGVNANARFVF